MVAPFDWDKLRIFHAAAEAGSFTQAAQILQLSQSAISRQVNALEQEIGVPLFYRHARGLLLTEQGEVLYNTTHNVFLELKTVHATLTESHKTAHGRLCITTTFGMGYGWLIDQISDFSEKYPNIQIQLRLDDLELNLSMRHADCAIRLHPPQQAELIQKKLFTVHTHVYASQNYILKYGVPENFDELKRHKLITFGQPVPPYLADLNWLETVAYPKGAHRVASLQMNSLALIKKAVKQNLGIAVIPDYLTKDEKDLIPILSHVERPPSFETFFCYPASLKHSAKLQAFKEYIFTQAQKWAF